MRRLIFVVPAMLAACGGGGEPDPHQTITLVPGTGALRVEVNGVRSSMGTVRCSLFNAPEGFPGPSPIIGGARDVPADSGTLSFDFPALPAGSYAISVQHDENGNGTLDTDFVGRPTEGYGVTNDVYPSARAPTFDEAKLELGDAETRSLAIHLKY